MAIGTAQERCPPPRRARAPRRRPQRDWKRLRLHPTICPGRSAGLGRSCQPEPPLAPAQARPCPQKCTVARLFRHPHHCCCCYYQTPSSQKHCRRSGRQEGSQASPSSAPVVANRAPSCAVPGPREGGTINHILHQLPASDLVEELGGVCAAAHHQGAPTGQPRANLHARQNRKERCI